MEIVFRESTPHDLDAFTVMTQTTYEDAYVDNTLGLTKECFSIDVFKSNDTQNYLKTKLINTTQQKSWLALDKNKIVGSVTIEDEGSHCEMTGFYVLPSYQGKGIGKQLWSRVLAFTKDKDITLDIYTHNKKTIELYEHWGFEEDTTKPHFYRHWPEWPAGLQAEAMYMRRRAS